MKLSLKKAIISAVVVLAGVSLLMPVASVFAVAPPVVLGTPAQQQTTTQPATQPAAQPQTTPAAQNNSSTPTSPSSTNANSSSSSTTSNDLPEATTARCEGGVLGWVLCPVIKLGQDFVASMEKLIVDQLDTGPIRSDGRYQNLHTAWAGFRDLANVFFIAIFLVIIFAQVLDIKMDSYSIKMMLPRLIVAAIAIQFSFFIMQIGVDISNVLGAGVAGVFNTVIKGGSDGGAEVGVVQAYGTLTLVGATGALAAGTAIVSGLAVPALLLLLAGALSLLGVVITVWLRVLVLQFLILLAPLAIVAWVMPNTEKWFSAWKNNVIKLLLMYPIIVFMISAGALATHITAITAENGPFAKMLGALVPILVFLMIPTAIKASGSLMNLTGNLVMGRMNNYSRAVRKSGLMDNAKDDLKKKAGILMDDYAKNKDGVTTFGQKSKAFVRRNVGRNMTGNTFSFGRSGQLKISKSIAHAHHEVSEEWATHYDQEGFTNPQLSQIAASLGDHSIEEVEVKNSYGKNRRYKTNHHMAEAALAQLVKQQGMVELSDLIDGPKVKDAQGNLTMRSGTGLFDHDTGQWRSKDIQKTVARAFGPNAGKVLEKITHAVHLQGDKAYGDLKAGNIANLGAGSGITAASQGVKWNRLNALAAVMDITNSGALASTVQNDVMKSYKRELKKAFAEGKFDNYIIDVQDYGKLNVGEFLDTFVSDGGQVTQVQGNIKRDQAAFDRILKDVLTEQEDLQAELDAARDRAINNPDQH